MTDTTNTTQAAALAVRDAAAALARRLPLYYGSGEPADEDLAQAIEDLPLPDVDVTDVDVTDWRAEAERLRGLLRHEQQERHAVLDRLDAAILARTASQAQAEQYLAELQQARELFARHAPRQRVSRADELAPSAAPDLADIADAARLAVRLDISVDIDGSTAFAHVDGYEDMDDCGYGSAEHDGTEPDKLRAWCEAVTLCAATIGLRMKENER